ncbi:Methionyl-tRNA formyltransferase [Ciborinia camelliae]|nr:Methionyl-tRNA formyltransferase [Ciborinia camelliae]
MITCESLRSLVKEKRSDPEGIASIDVLIRPGKKFGRGLKEIRQVPLKSVAEELGLPVHERDTFTGWDVSTDQSFQLPKPDGQSINLIVAVSFGLFVPPRILNSAEYGGINVHPSLLPQYRGSAPLHHTILNGDTITGVTLQTLDPHKFDHGVVLSQEGFPIPQPSTINFKGLLDFITPKAANLLAKGIRDRVFVNPEANEVVKLASKVKPIDRYIDCEGGLSIKIEQKYRALGRLWCYTKTWWSRKDKRRTIFEDFEVVPLPEHSLVPEHELQRVYRVFPKWEFFCTPVYRDPTHPGAIIIPTVEKGLGLRVKHILVEGQVVGSAIDAVHRLSTFTKDPNHEDGRLMTIALTDISEDGSQPVVRDGKGVEYGAKHLDFPLTVKINEARHLDLNPMD